MLLTREVFDAVREYSTSGGVGIFTIKASRKEMKALEEAGDLFSAYHIDHKQPLHNISRSGGTFAKGSFHIEIIIDNLIYKYVSSLPSRP
jgi:hypothetical protein